MLTSKQVKEIKEHLEKAQNPLFFFDNDADGLCSFLLLQRFLGRGKGIPIRSFPDLSKDYIKRIQELNADYVFILDKPVVSEDFFKELNLINLPVVWIDHHDTDKGHIPDFVNYYNPLFNKTPSNEPVTSLCYQITQVKNDLWIAVAGSIADRFVPDFYKEFNELYPDLAFKSENAFDIFYKSQIGVIVKMFNFGLKDRITNVVSMMKFLMKVKSPYEVLKESSSNYLMHKRFKEVEQKYQKLLEKAKSVAEDSEKIVFFQYSGDLSISSDLANELSYLFPKKIVVVIYLAGIKANISIRGKKIREPLLKVIHNLESASGGGHEDAVGAQVRVEDLDSFKKQFEKSVS